MGELEINRVRVYLTEEENRNVDDEMIQVAINYAVMYKHEEAPIFSARIVRSALQKMRSK